MSLPVQKSNQFPWEIFEPHIYENFKDISRLANIPIEFLGVEAIFAVAALAGNMYMLNINGGVKPLVFVAKVGPSGIGKSPAYEKVIGNIIRPLRFEYEDQYRLQLDQYEQRVRDSKKSK